MSNMENKNFGEQIRDIVQDSLNSMDFQDLNKKIGDTVNGTIAEVRKSLNLDGSAGEGTAERPNRGSVTDAEGTVYGSYREVNEREKAMRRVSQSGAYGQTGQGAQRNAYNAAGQNAARGNGYHTAQNSSYGAAGAQAGSRSYSGSGRAGQGSAAQYREADRGQVPPAFTNTMRTKEELQAVPNRQNSGGQAGQRYGNQAQSRYQNRSTFPVSTSPHGRVSGVLYIVFGFMVFGPLALAAIIWAMTVLVGGSWSDVQNFIRVFTVVFCPLLLVSGAMAVRGILQRKRVSRFRSYVRELRGKTFIAIRELAYRTNRSEKFLVKDLQKMIKLRMFPEGHLDQQKSCLMLTHDSFEQYLSAQNSLEERQRAAVLKAQEERQAKLEEARREKEAAKAQSRSGKGGQEETDIPEELRVVIAEGREYIRQMREANDAIPGEDISRKLTRLELIIDKIFTHVEKHPEQTDELHKFMDYYLPTTLKLVNAYREFDAQPVQGDNIRKAKLEIEATLDTINSAFEKLFDSMFEDAAMDVSTDISVLETMLAQEGLTGEHFSQ